ncbi:hypothetical protein GCM10027299_12790 [Larkinella ripae]
MLASVQVPIFRFKALLNVNVALDKGEVYTNAIGSFISLKKELVNTRTTVMQPVVNTPF